MTASTADRRTILKEGLQVVAGVYAATKVNAGTIMQINATGYAVPGSATIANRTAGICEKQADNTAGSSGAINATARRQIAGIFVNSTSTDLITIADVGNDCYVVDDVTVAKTDSSGTRPKAGKIIGVDTSGVHVWFY